jgi:DNA polymerase-3 subunit epsilon
VSTLSERALAYLRAGPRAPLDIVRDVLGLPRANRAVADRLAAALLGADPRFAFDVDGLWSVVPEPAWRGVRLEEVRYAVVDVETTGLSPRRGDRITEIAVVHVDGPRVAVALDTLVNPERPIPPRIEALTGISDALVAHAPRFEDLVEDVLGALAGRVFVAHHARFDWRFLTAEMSRAAGHELRMPRACTVRLTRALVPELERRSLDSLMHHFGLATERRHRAAGDAEVTARVLLRLLARSRDLGIATWEELQELGR